MSTQSIPSPASAINLQDFRDLHHAFTLVGMSGIGKTVLSSSLRHTGNWYHYSADYRIGTRYLAEDILDNIKYKIMNMGDTFVANLLRSDSIYIQHNISVDNLEPVSTFLGMYGDSKQGGHDKQTFLHRQDLYRRAEVNSMFDVDHFIDKSWRLYRCQNFVNDASGSLCEICDPQNPEDEVMSSLRDQSLIIYIEPDDGHEETLKERARLHPKPMFYNPDFLLPQLGKCPDDGIGIEPLDFARPLFPDLLAFRKPRYEAIAKNFGFTISADVLANAINENTSSNVIDAVYDVVISQARKSRQGEQNLHKYLEACQNRQSDRSGNA